MKREFLKGLDLDDETIAAIMAEHGKDVETYKGQISQLRSDIQGKDAIIQNHQTDFDNKVSEEVKKVRNGILVDNAINEKFKDTDPLLKELLMDKIDKSKITVNDSNQVNGLDEQFNPLMDKYKSLFPSNQNNGDDGKASENKGQEDKSQQIASGVQIGSSPKVNNPYETLDYKAYKALRQKEEKGE